MREQVLRQAVDLVLARATRTVPLKQAHKELSDPEKYTDKSLNQLYVKHIGRTFEELETRVLREHFDVYYSRLKYVGWR